MRILVLGAHGFIGKRISQELERDQTHEVLKGVRNPLGGNEHQVDLLDIKTIEGVLRNLLPDVVIQCAGIVENTEKSKQNPIFTKNLLNTVVGLGLHPKNIIILGSAAEYGVVNKNELPVKETTPLRATNAYGLSKIEETTIALKFRQKYNLPITIARIFNPIGPGMHEKFLTSRILSQINDVKAGIRENIEVNRLDSLRDYVNITDLTGGIMSIALGDPKQDIYNIGSGKPTSNGELVELLLAQSGLKKEPQIIESSTEPEPLYACQADISRMQTDFSWSPNVTLEDTVKEIVDEQR